MICGLPLLPPIIVSNDTIESSSMSFICPTFDPETVYTTVCNQEGDWEPRPVDICQLGMYNNLLLIITFSILSYTKFMATANKTMLDSLTLAAIFSISVFIFTSIVFFLFGYVCRCRQEYRKSARQISENTMPELATEQVDLTRNEAYDIFKIGIS